MNRRQMILATGGAATLGIAGGAALVLWPRAAEQFAQCQSSSVAGGGAQIGGSFELVRQDGRTVTEAEVIDRLSLVYFGYTYCPDVCPLDVSRNADAVDRLAATGIEVRPIFITVDPARDTPEVVGEFVSYMHEDMIGLTGSDEQVDAVKRAYKAFGQAMEGDAETYLVNHSTFSYLMHPDWGLLDFYRNDLTAEEMADRISCFAATL